MNRTIGFHILGWLLGCDCNSAGGCEKCRVVPYVMTAAGELRRKWNTPPQNLRVCEEIKLEF